MDTPTKEKPSLQIRRHYPAAPEKLYGAWTQPEAMKRWFAPGDAFSVPTVEADVRVGGRYRIVMKSPEGEEHDVSGTYREVVPNRKLVFTWAWKSTPERQSLVSVEFTAAGGGTDLVLVHSEFADEEAKERHNQGWMGCLGRLERTVAA